MKADKGLDRFPRFSCMFCVGHVNYLRLPELSTVYCTFSNKLGEHSSHDFGQRLPRLAAKIKQFLPLFFSACLIEIRSSSCVTYVFS